jgi:homospermidine synthase
MPRHQRTQNICSTGDFVGHDADAREFARPNVCYTSRHTVDLQKALAEKKFSEAQSEQIAHHAKAREFNHLAHQLGVKVIHCSERDTQITDQPKQVNEFVNTWSVEGFREEGRPRLR